MRLTWLIDSLVLLVRKKSPGNFFTSEMFFHSLFTKQQCVISPGEKYLFTLFRMDPRDTSKHDMTHVKYPKSNDFVRRWSAPSVGVAYRPLGCHPNRAALENQEHSRWLSIHDTAVGQKMGTYFHDHQLTSLFEWLFGCLLEFQGFDPQLYVLDCVSPLQSILGFLMPIRLVFFHMKKPTESPIEKTPCAHGSSLKTVSFKLGLARFIAYTNHSGGLFFSRCFASQMGKDLHPKIAKQFESYKATTKPLGEAWPEVKTRYPDLQKNLWKGSHSQKV